MFLKIKLILFENVGKESHLILSEIVDDQRSPQVILLLTIDVCRLCWIWQDRTDEKILNVKLFWFALDGPSIEMLKQICQEVCQTSKKSKWFDVVLCLLCWIGNIEKINWCKMAVNADYTWIGDLVWFALVVVDWRFVELKLILPCLFYDGIFVWATEDCGLPVPETSGWKENCWQALILPLFWWSLSSLCWMLIFAVHLYSLRPKLRWN